MSDREKLIELLQKIIRSSWAERIADHLIANGVTVQKHGRWFGTHDGWYYSYSCSECGAEALTKDETMHDQVCSNYCPNCGAKMDLKGETE